MGTNVIMAVLCGVIATKPVGDESADVRHDLAAAVSCYGCGVLLGALGGSAFLPWSMRSRHWCSPGLVEDAVAKAVVEDAAALRSAAAADMVRTLVTAGVLEQAAALDAIDALPGGGLIDPYVVDAALDDVAAAAGEHAPAGGDGAR